MTRKKIALYCPRYPQDVIQEQLAKHRFCVLVAHRRLGKSLLAINHVILMALKCKNWQPHYAYIAPFLKQAKLIAWEYLKFYTKEFPGVRVNESELWVEILGRRIYLFGADNPDAIRGAYWDGVIFDEYAQIKPNVWSEIIYPALTDRKGWALFLGTPKGNNQFFDIYNTAMKHMQQGNENWWAGLYTVYDTNIMSAEEIEQTKSVMSESAFRQEFLCCMPGSLVYTSRGQIPIEQIKVGDIVLSHSGRFRQVLKTMCNEHDGEMVSIGTYGDAKTIDVTPNHPVRVLDKAKQIYKWIPASEIKVGDLMVRPRRKFGDAVIKPELAELLTWYICEGSCSKTGIGISLGLDEEMEAERVRRCANVLGYNITECISGNVRNLIITNTSFADFVVNSCGKMSYNKRIPWELISGHEELVYKVLMLGDGCTHIRKRDQRKINVYVTVSETLAYDVQMLAGMLGYRAGISRKKGGTDIILGRTVNVREKFNVIIDTILGRQDGNTKTYPAKHGIGVKVRSVNAFSYVGKVYNMEVQHDNSYIVNGRTVHNCDFTASDDNVLITIDMVTEAIQRIKLPSDIKGTPKLLGIDVARFGGDSSVIQRRQGSMAYPVKIFTKLDNMQFAGLVAQEMDEFKPDATFIDSGRGEGVIDRLRQMKYDVIEVNFGGKATNENHYANKRIEMWDTMRQWLETRGSIPNDPILRVDLVTPLFKFDAHNRMLLESKDEIKKRIGRSTDRADALALTFAFPVKTKNETFEESFISNMSQKKQNYDPFKDL